MNNIQKTVFKWVCGTHAGVLFLLLFIPWIRGCIHPKPKENFISVSFAASMPAPPELAPIPEPESVVPQPKAKPIPKPAITNTPPKVIKPAPKKEPPKPKPKKVESKPAPKPAPKLTEAERLAAIRQNNPVKRPVTQTAPQLDFSGIQSALNSASSGSGSGSESGTYSPFAGYYDSVKRQIYAVWQQPAGAPIGLGATATIRVERDGTVSSKSLIRRSGNALFDQSVQNALNATTRLPVPPADLPDRTISIEFLLAD